MRLALFTLESLANATAVRRFVASHGHDLVLVGLSDPFRQSMGGSLGQTWRHLKRSGPRFLPYLAANFSLPRLRGALPARRANRDAEDQPLRDLCAALDIPAIVVSDVNDTDIRDRLRSLDVDLLISFHFDQIFDAQTLGIARLGGVNVHPSLLPQHRGPVPTLHALLEHPPRFGVTVHRLVPQIDAGPILAQAPVTLPERTTALRAASLLHERGGELLDAVLPAIASGTAHESHAATLPYCPFPTRSQLRDVSKRGLSAADWADICAALKLSIR
ncbi:formyltransferase family protein [Pararobbsia silviterrae]|uniref:Formyl transferase n=1 Tax=Pararobbsia silviterrae TaxID=1792498 RepID=A0A494XHU4_9BURK|nr:formyltransferase family protein [Pararobbsia silviterrae]RKP47739.1 formyl transferase [Pararobbsia silviterrae]